VLASPSVEDLSAGNQELAVLRLWTMTGLPGTNTALQPVRIVDIAKHRISGLSFIGLKQ
jgi:hypothetical protein